MIRIERRKSGKVGVFMLTGENGAGNLDFDVFDSIALLVVCLADPSPLGEGLHIAHGERECALWTSERSKASCLWPMVYGHAWARVDRHSYSLALQLYLHYQSRSCPLNSFDMLLRSTITIFRHVITCSLTLVPIQPRS